MFEGQEVGFMGSFGYPNAWGRWDLSQGRQSSAICQLSDLEEVALLLGICFLPVN